MIPDPIPAGPERKLEGTLISIDRIKWGVDMTELCITEKKSAHLFEDLRLQTDISILDKEGNTIRIPFMGIVLPDSISHPVKYFGYLSESRGLLGGLLEVRQELIDLTLNRRYVCEVYQRRSGTI